MNTSVKPTISIYPNGLVVAEGAIVPKSRIVGIFDIKMAQIKMISDKKISEGTCTIVARGNKRRSFIMLDTGESVISPFTVQELWDNYSGISKLKKRATIEEDDE